MNTNDDSGRAEGKAPFLTANPVPDHELLRCIAEGSYGEVWLARNVMGTYRAVKIIRRSSFDHDRPFEREREGIQQFEPISRSHDGFVDVLQVGRNERERYFYYVMELGDDAVTGQQIQPEAYRPKTLAGDVAARGRLAVEDCLRLSLSLTDALDHLHSKGLSHRDIKPANIIFIHGIPKLADIGLVAAIGPDRSYVGTEGYIPPEGPGTTQADIFALGKVLYEIATGKDRHDFPELPDDFDRFADAEEFREFNEVILKACQPEVKKRFSSAREMNIELSLLLSGKSVRRLRLLEKRWRLFKRMGIVAAAILAVAGSIAYPVILHERQTQADRERRIGVAAVDGFHAMNEGNMIGAFASFSETLRLTEGMKKREELQRIRCGASLAQCPKIIQMWFHTNDIYYLSVHPDGRHVLVTDKRFFAQILDVENGVYSSAPLIVPGINSASFSPDGRYIITADDDNLVQLWDAQNMARLRTWPHNKDVLRAKFSPDGSTILTACGDNIVRLWSVESDTLIWQFNGHYAAVRAATFSRDGRLILTASNDLTARILDAKTGRQIGEPLQHSSWVYEGDFSPDGRHVVTGCFDRKARIWEVETGRFIPPVLNHGDGVSKAEYSPDGSLIVTACMDGTVRLWETDSQLPTRVNSVLRHSSPVISVTFNPDGSRIVSGCVDGTTRVWDISANSFRPRTNRNYYSPDCSRYLEANRQEARLWTVEPSRPCSPSLPLDRLINAVFSQDGRWFLTIRTNSDIGAEFRLWEAATGAPIAPGFVMTDTVGNLTLGNDGMHFVNWTNTNARIWNARSGNPVSEPQSFTSMVKHAVFSPDNKRLLILTGNDVRIFDPMTGKEARAPIRFPTEAWHAVYSPNGERLVISCADGQQREWWAQIWDANFNHPVGALLRHRDGVLGASYSYDGKRIATGGEDFVARIWDAETGAPLTPMMKHENQVSSANFSQDSRFLLTASTDQTARIWDADSGEPLTPPILHKTSLSKARFFVGSYRFLAESKYSSESWLWNLPIEKRPVKDLLALAILLSGARPDEEELSIPNTRVRRKYLESIWKELKAKYPQDHSTVLEDLLYWHSQRAELAESTGRWKSAIIHWNALATAEPANPDWQARRARAERYLPAQSKQ